MGRGERPGLDRILHEGVGLFFVLFVPLLCGHIANARGRKVETILLERVGISL